MNINLGHLFIFLNGFYQNYMIYGFTFHFINIDTVANVYKP